MLDATKSEEHKRLLETELDAVGIRLNKRKPDVVFKRKTTGGVSSHAVYHSTTVETSARRTDNGIVPIVSTMTLSYSVLKFNTTVKLTKTDDKTIRTILAGCTFTPHEIGLLLIISRQTTQLRCYDS